jgi:S1-C subfamily serine protease
MLRWRFLLVASCCFLLAGSLVAQDSTDLYKKVVRSAVFIVTPARGGIGMGSGSIVDLEQRIIITNYHVVGDAEWVFVQFPIDDDKGKMITDKKVYLGRIRDEKALKAKVLKTDKKRDLAILKLETAPPPGTPALPLATKEPGRGAEVWNVGSPGAVEQVFSITRGTVRAVAHEKFPVGGGDDEPFVVEARMITTDNPINQGDSGGPLVNAAGEMVGVSQSGKLGGTVKLVSNFVDVSEVKTFLKENKIEVKVTAPTPKKETPKNDPPKDTPKNDPPKDTPKPKDAPSPQAERSASDALRLAKLLASNEDSRDKYKEKLQDIIKKFPGTVGAKEAQRLLDGLK